MFGVISESGGQDNCLLQQNHSVSKLSEELKNSKNRSCEN